MNKESIINNKSHNEHKKVSKKTTAIIAGISCALSLGIGIPITIMSCNNKVSEEKAKQVQVTFDAGDGHFRDGTRVKVLTVNEGTLLSQIPHDFPAITYTFKTSTTNTSENGSIYDIENSFETKMWVTDTGEKIDETFGETNMAIVSDTYLFADYASDLTAAKSVAIGEIGNKATAAIARQPEAEDLILAAMRTAFSWIEIADDGYEALAIGQSTGSGIAGIARQPEANDKICNALLEGYAQFHNNMPNDSRNVGLGIMLGDAVEGIARQPEAAGKINGITYLTYQAAKRAKVPSDGYAMGIAAGTCCDAIARQPEADGKIREALLEGFDYINYSDDSYESFAIGITTAKVGESIARQPEAEGKIRRAAHIAFTVFHSLPNDGRVEYLSATSASVAEAIARQPEAEGKINNMAMMVYEAAHNITNPTQGQALGNAGDAAVTGVARQPEAEGKIRKALYYAIYEILRS